MDKSFWIDISYPMHPGMAIYPGNPPLEVERVRDIENGDGATISRIVMGTHTGTHIDAPAHSIPGGATLDYFPLERMNGIAKVIDVTGHKEIGVELLKDDSEQNYDIMLFRTDNSLRWSCDRIMDDYVTLSYDAAEKLALSNIKLVGIDYLTIEKPRNRRIEGRSIHRSLLGNNVLICEALDLNDISEGVYKFHCFPLCVKGLDGSPARCFISAL